MVQSGKRTPDLVPVVNDAPDHDDGTILREGDDGGAMPFMCSVAKEAKAAYMGEIQAHLDVLFIEFRFCGAQERKVGEEDVARHTHSARQTDDSEEDEKDHFETTKKKNLKTLERHRRQSANRYRHHSNPNHHHHHHHRP